MLGESGEEGVLRDGRSVMRGWLVVVQHSQQFSEGCYGGTVGPPSSSYELVLELLNMSHNNDVTEFLVLFVIDGGNIQHSTEVKPGPWRLINSFTSCLVLFTFF